MSDIAHLLSSLDREPSASTQPNRVLRLHSVNYLGLPFDPVVFSLVPYFPSITREAEFLKILHTGAFKLGYYHLTRLNMSGFETAGVVLGAPLLIIEALRLRSFISFKAIRFHLGAVPLPCTDSQHGCFTA